jgi:hypothetical protein
VHNQPAHTARYSLTLMFGEHQWQWAMHRRVWLNALVEDQFIPTARAAFEVVREHRHKHTLTHNACRKVSKR